MFELSKELLFVHDGGNTPFLDDPALVHFLHGKQLLFLFLLHLPNFAEAAPPNHILKLEMALVHSYTFQLPSPLSYMQRCRFPVRF